MSKEKSTSFWGGQTAGRGEGAGRGGKERENFLTLQFISFFGRVYGVSQGVRQYVSGGKENPS